MTAPVNSASPATPAISASVQDALLAPARAWFASRGWTPFPFQLEAWRAFLSGADGLLHAPTGSGKTYGVWIGPLLKALADGEAAQPPAIPAPGVARRTRARNTRPPRADRTPLRVLWLTPLRALAGDTALALQAAVDGLGLNWSVELRTGDTGSYLRRKQRDRLPSALVTTPESLSLLLSYPDAAEQLRGLSCVIVDEWHELLGTKRGVQTELCLARLRRLSPGLRTWGLSATLGNLPEALAVLSPPGAAGARAPAVLVSADERKHIEVDTLIPDNIERFPWAGHLGIRLLGPVIDRIEQARSTLLFTNTRSQTEIWFQSILRARPDLIGQIGLHHGSIDRELRGRIEDHLRAGTLRCVVCTSSLDLGVDFQPVDQVIQVGSPKGVVRLLQRAGRSGHQPGKPSRIICVPTSALELVEFAAAQDAIAARRLESRTPLRLALDVLVQHIVTLAAGAGDAGAAAEELLAEARATHAFAGLSDEQWGWCLDFVARGGAALATYPQYARLVETTPGSGRYRVASPAVARLHRLGVGTIVSDPGIMIRVSRTGRGEGKALGSIEEGFLARLTPGDTFAFAGRMLKLIRIREMTAYTTPATRVSGRAPSWAGARMPLSAQLAGAVRVKLQEAARGEFASPPMRAVEPLLRLQAERSRLPRPDELLIEHTRTGEGHHAFLFPLEGRLVHEGLAALLAYRIARLAPRSFSYACNDYGLELVSPDPWRLDEAQWRGVLSGERLGEDLLACLNAAELARRQFREIARIAGLLVPSFPGQPRRLRHLQASSEMFWEVLTQFDPASMLLDQARREVLERQLEVARLKEAIERLRGVRLVITQPARLTPFAFPLWADSLREQVSSERWSDRVKKMLLVLEADAAGGTRPGAAAPDPDPSPASAPASPPGPVRRRKAGAKGGGGPGWRGPRVRSKRPRL